jgi:predicted enzyme related to lactoylglutathione lyase
MEVTSHTQGAFCFAELVTPDTERARRFYGELFGWKSVGVPESAGSYYTVFKIGQESVAGAIEIERNWGTLPPRWQVLFAVDDCDTRLARARALGGVNDFEPIDVPRAGRLVGIRDPANAHFVIVQAATAPVEAGVPES